MSKTTDLIEQAEGTLNQIETSQWPHRLDEEDAQELLALGWELLNELKEVHRKLKMTTSRRRW